MLHLLKRFFALCLTAALLASGAAAAEPRAAALTDLGLVTHREAVSLMVDLGIIEGKSDGIFAPDEVIDRASMSKMIFSMMMGGENAAAYQGVKTDLTDIAGTWGEPYIKYCYKLGIVAGVGHGKFDPTGRVAVASAAKMLLVTLGFDAKTQGYESDPLWAENIMRDAEQVGLMEGISQLGFEGLTRDNAAQMIYNALFIPTRRPIYGIAGNETRIVNYRVNVTPLGLETLGLVKCVLTVGDTTGDGGAPALRFSGAYPAAATYGDSGGVLRKIRSGEAGFRFGPAQAAGNVAVYLKTKYTLDAGGAAVEHIDFQSIYSTALAPAELTLLGRSADGTCITAPVGESLTAKGSTRFLAETDDAPATAYFINGLRVSGEKANAAAGRRGVVVELLDADNDGKADMVRILEKTVKVLTGSAETRWEGDLLMVRLPGVLDWTRATLVSGWAELRAGDVALVLTLGDTVAITKAPEIGGKVTRNDAGLLCIDKIGYPLSDLTPAPFPTGANAEGEYRCWLDEGGAIVAAAKVAP